MYLGKKIHDIQFTPGVKNSSKEDFFKSYKINNLVKLKKKVNKRVNGVMKEVEELYYPERSEKSLENLWKDLQAAIKADDEANAKTRKKNNKVADRPAVETKSKDEKGSSK